MKIHDVIIIGAGQSGLSLGYYLSNKDYLILDEGEEFASSWKNRYDSLKLFTNRRHDSLPGMKFKGNQNGFPTKDEVVNYLEEYIEKFKIKIQLNTKVVNIKKDNNLFKITTKTGDIYEAKNVVIATGLSHTPFIPEISKNFNKNIIQIHSKEYKNPSQIKGKKVLVIGGGNSGVQIVEELTKSGKEVYFSFKGELPSLKNNFMRWFVFSYFLLPVFFSYESFISRYFSNYKKIYIFGTNLNKLFKLKNIIRVGEIKEINNQEIICEKIKLNNIDNIIWATGFKLDFSWIDFPIFRKDGYPTHKRGETQIKGLYFLGFSRLYWEKKNFILGAKKEAKYIYKKLI